MASDENSEFFQGVESDAREVVIEAELLARRGRGRPRGSTGKQKRTEMPANQLSVAQEQGALVEKRKSIVSKHDIQLLLRPTYDASWSETNEIELRKVFPESEAYKEYKMENRRWKQLQKAIPLWKDCLRLHSQTPFAIVSPARGLEYSGVWRSGSRSDSFLSWIPAFCLSLHKLLLHGMFQDHLGISMLTNMLVFTAAFHHGDERPFRVEKTAFCPVFDGIIEAAASNPPTPLRKRVKRLVSARRDAPGGLHMRLEALFIDHLGRTVAVNEADRTLCEREDLYDRPVKILTHEALAALIATLDSFGTSSGNNRFPILLSVDVSYEMFVSIKRKRGHPSSSDAIIEMHANGFLAELRRSRRVAGSDKAPSNDSELSTEAGDVEISGDAAVAVSQNHDHDEDMALVNSYDEDEGTGAVTMSQKDEAAPMIDHDGDAELVPPETPHEVLENRGRDEAPLSFGPVAPESNGGAKESRVKHTKQETPQGQEREEGQGQSRSRGDC